MPHELKLNGKTSWDSTLPVVHNEQDLDNRWDHIAIGSGPPEATITFFACPRAQCSKVEPSSAKSFQYRDLDILMRCTSCKKGTAVRTWRCACDSPWHICGVHRTYHNCGKGTRPQCTKMDKPIVQNENPSANRTKRKRSLGQELVAQDDGVSC